MKDVITLRACSTSKKTESSGVKQAWPREANHAIEAATVVTRLGNDRAGGFREVGRPGASRGHTGPRFHRCLCRMRRLEPRAEARRLDWTVGH